MIRFEPAKKKEVIEILTNPVTFYKCYGYEYKKGNRIHISKYNYLVKENNEVLGLLQVDEFTDQCAMIHGCLKPEYCVPELVQATTEAGMNLFAATSFRKIATIVPANANHILRLLKKLDFKEEGRITKGMTYRNELVDCITLTYDFRRD